MKKSIGGFFEKENLTGNYNSFHSSDAIKVVNGRSALFILLMKIMPSKVRLPFYSCDSLLQPILKLDIPFEYYSIDKNFMPIADAFEKDDLVIFINYFGLLENRIIAFTAQNDIQHFLVDNTQSFFIKPKNYYAFNSARKFFGVTDGAFLFPNNLKFENDLESISFSEEFLNLRSQGDLENGYSLYQKNELSQPCEYYKMSEIADNILCHLDYDEIGMKRKENFIFLNEKLNPFNTLGSLSLGENIPFVFPFLPTKSINRQSLFDKGIFFPTLWKEVLEKKNIGFDRERNLSAYLIPLPIDHRYSLIDMEYIFNQLLKQLK